MVVDSDGARTSSSDKNASDWRVKGGFIPMEKSNGCMRYARQVHVAYDKCEYERGTETRRLISASHVIPFDAWVSNYVC